jgi:hypothetical protein
MNCSSFMRIGVVTLLFLLMGDQAAARCVDSATKIVATYPNLFELSSLGCSKGRLVDDLGAFS